MTKRQDSQLTADALNALRLEDCKRYIVEWTFRILEMPGVSDDPENLIKYLCEQFESNAERDYLQTYKAKQFRAITDAFCAGHLSLGMP